MKYIIIFIMSLFLTSCFDSSSKGDVYTLYRTSPIDPSWRIHMATFDAADSGSYNQDNCELGRQLFQSQPGIITRFYCEKGTFRK